jgi:hypothetical protein
MPVLAVDDVWVGVIGTAVGGVIGVLSSWLVHRWQRADTIAERSRTERWDAYGEFLKNAEDSLHRFQWLAERHVPPERFKEERTEANYFYDQEVTPRLMVLKIFGPPEVVKAASGLRRALNDIRKLMVEVEPPPTDESRAFKKAHASYRKARDAFIERAGSDLEHVRRKRRWFRTRPRIRSSNPLNRAEAVSRSKSPEIRPAAAGAQLGSEVPVPGAPPDVLIHGVATKEDDRE